MSEMELHHSRRSFSLFIILAVAIVMLLFLQAAGTVFIELGLPTWLALLIIPGSLIGSFVNIPIATVESDKTPCVEQDYLSLWGLSYKVKTPDCPGKLRLSINLGGAIIPISVSMYLLLEHLETLVPALLGVVVITVFVHAVARIEPNVGIVTPALLPPIAAALITLSLIQFIPTLQDTYVVAYVSGTLGALLGADILNLGKITQLRTGSASIGGAGTWDGVFLTGILAIFFL
ncbi:MAG: hypothetical protein C4K49_01160 [Candidatus Thorarchaeota archaeon]|nr:MAG: hypothetical protein C4K49_01160 [Candidatus Thorarchaeota archaeon]